MYFVLQFLKYTFIIFALPFLFYEVEERDLTNYFCT